MMYEDASQVANDAVGSIRTVASFCAEEKMMQLYSKKCEGPLQTGIKQGLISGSGFGLSFFLIFAVYATNFYAGAQLVKHGQVTFSDVFQVSLKSSSIGTILIPIHYVCNYETETDIYFGRFSLV